MTPSTDPVAALDGQAQGPPTPARTDEEIPEMGSEAWRALNRRRLDLINKLVGEGLSPEERREYDDLERRAEAVILKAFPAPTKLAEDLDRIEARLTAEEAKRG